MNIPSTQRLVGGATASSRLAEQRTDIDELVRRRMSPPSSVRLTWVLTGVLVTLCALLAGPDAWAVADGHKWESLACFLDLSGVWWAWGVVSAPGQHNGYGRAGRTDHARPSSVEGHAKQNES